MRYFRAWAPTVVGAVSEIAMVGVGSNRAVTASRLPGDTHPGNTDKLKLTVWDVDSSSGEYKIVGQGDVWEPPIEQVAITVASGYVVTAVRDKASNDLRIASFRLSDKSDGNVDIARVATKSDGLHAVNEIAISPVGNGGAPIVMTALRNGAGHLVVATWGLESGFGNPDIRKLDEWQLQTGEASKIAIETSSKGAVTALRNSLGDLELIAWHVDPDGVIKGLRKNHDPAGPVSQVAIAGLGDDRFLLATRNGSGYLELITWMVYNDGTVHRLKDFTDDLELIDDNRVAVVSVGPDLADGNFELAPNQVACAAVDASGKLKLSLFDVSSHNAPTRNGATSLDPASHVTIAVAGRTTKIGDFGAVKTFDHLITAVRDKDGKLSLVYWETYYSGVAARFG